MTSEELKKVLENHKHWIMEDCKNWENMRAYLRNADLRNADLRNAYLSGADLSGAKNVPFIPSACPDFGMFIGFKKAINPSDRSRCIVVLEIPEDARRLSATGRKCRCDKAKVLQIQNIDDSVPYNCNYAVSNYNNDFVYKVGEIVTPDQFCEDRWQECASGIHFFINRQEAVDYCL